MRVRASMRGVWVLAVLLVTLAAWTTVRETGRGRKAPFADFNHMQTGAECLVAGCDPYDFATLNAEAERRQERKPTIWPMTPVYPASSLIVVLPFEGMGWPMAAYAFNGLAGLLTAVACVLMVVWLRIRVLDAAALVLIAVLMTNPIAAAFEFANPALLDAALMTIGCLLLLRGRATTLGWVLLGIALALKPQLAVGAAVVLLWKPETRVAAAKACGLSVALLLIGLVSYRLRLGSFHYLASLRYALWLSELPAGSSDFANNEAWDFLNIQSAFAKIPGVSRAVVQGLAWLTTVGLAAAVAWVGAKRDALRLRPWTMIALAVAISLLPLYHRGYDRVIALALVPAAMELGAMRRWLAWGYAVLVTVWVVNDTVMGHVLKRWHFKPQSPVEGVMFCVLLLVSLWWVPGEDVEARSPSVA